MKKIFLLFIVSFLLSCSNSGEVINCFTPPQPAYFKFVSATNGENLITNGSLNSSHFSVKDSEGKTVEFKVITENNLNEVVVYVGWYNGTKNYTFDLGDSKNFSFSVKSHQLTGDCGGYIVDKVEIVDHPYSMESNFYLIKF